MNLEVSVELHVDGFDLDVHFGSTAGITALFGPSGAGKTLTLRCIAGLMRPDSGSIVLNDRVLFSSVNRTDVPTRERSIGFVFQHYALFPHFDVAGNIGYGLRGLPKQERNRRVRELLEIVDLAGFEARRPRDLSGGQRQRVALARTLAIRPSLIMLDEPLAAVDLGLRKKLRSELRRIHEITQIPMLLVTHDLAEVRQLTDFLVLFDAGRVIRSGSTAELLSGPLPNQLSELFEEI